MFNFSGIRRHSPLGSLLRLPLRLLPKNMAVRIWQGKLRGTKWIVGSSNHGCWLGSFEFDKQNLIAGAVTPGAVFLDVGAHAGFYTLLASHLVQAGGKVFAFEPLPRNIAYLERHLEINQVKNVTLFKAAVADRPGKAAFQTQASSYMGKLSESGEISVDVVALDDLYRRGLLPLPDFLKIDVEGAEAAVLAGAHELLTAGKPTIFLATHGPEVHAKCLALLQGLGYTCKPVDAQLDLQACDELVATKTAAPALA